MRRRVLLVLFAIASVFGRGERRYTVKRDRPYDASGIHERRFDAYRPVRGRRPIHGWPVLVYFHGGGWMSGDKREAEALAELLCPQGYELLAIDYRLTIPSKGGQGARWPAQLEDGWRALRYFRENAAWLGLDPDRMATIGISAGGHLATMLALRDDPQGGRPTVAVDMDGEMDMTLPAKECMAGYEDIMTKALGHGAPFGSAELRDISPIAFVRSDVSVLLIHGDKDDNVYVKNADVMSAALKAKGADVEFLRLEGALGRCHGTCWKAAVAKEKLRAFLESRLKKQRWL